MNRVATNYIMTRAQARYIAKKNMKEAGLKQICKPCYNDKSGRHYSYFSKQWRNFVTKREDND